MTVSRAFSILWILEAFGWALLLWKMHANCSIQIGGGYTIYVEPGPINWCIGAIPDVAVASLVLLILATAAVFVFSLIRRTLKTR